MSHDAETPTKTPNGDHNPPSVDPIDNATLLARIEVCIARSDIASKEATKARESAEATHALVLDVKKAAARIASDQFELRTGIPVKWRRRLLLVAFSTAIGAVSGALAALFLLRHL